MEILFTGNKSEKKTYSYSVKENNYSNTIIFVLDHVQEDIYLETLHAFVKVEGANFIDKVPLAIEYEGEEKINIRFTLLRKHTTSRVLKIQLQFEGSEDIVWQTEILTLVLSETIKADKYIENKYPAVLVKHEQELSDHEARITAIEEKPEIDAYSKEETDALLDEKQDVLTFDNVPTAGSNNPVKSGGVFLSLQEVINIAEGKTQSFTLSAETNPIFDSQDDYIEVSSFVDINGNTIDTTKLHVGDICLITQLQIPDRWVADITNGVAKLYQMETAKVDLSDYYTKTEANQKFVDLENEQTISGIKTFLGRLRVKKATEGGGIFEVSPDGNGMNVKLVFANNVLLMLHNGGVTFYRDLLPDGNGTRNIGSKGARIKKIFVKEGLSDGTNEFSVADISNGLFNVINASDIVNNTLTQAQYDLIKNGKPTRISGTLLSFDNILIEAVIDYSNNVYKLYFVASRDTNKDFYRGVLNLNKSTKVLSLEYGRMEVLANLSCVNGKQIPAYPTDDTKNYTLKLIAGVLTWVEDN